MILLKILATLFLIIIYIIPLILIFIISGTINIATTKDLTDTKTFQKFIYPLVYIENNWFKKAK